MNKPGIAAALACAGLAAVVPASAATISYDIPYATQAIAVPQFDPALGTLNAATFTITGHLDYPFIDQTPAPTTGTYSYHAFYSFYYFDRWIDFGVDGAGTADFGTSPIVYLPADGMGMGAIDNDRLIFAIGTGTFGGSITFDPPSMLDVMGGVIIPGDPADASVSGMVTIVYDYTAAAVPEASTWAMMLAGFGLIGMGLRRRPMRVLAGVRP